jgi:hypothetical protein
MSIRDATICAVAPRGRMPEIPTRALAQCRSSRNCGGARIFGPLDRRDSAAAVTGHCAWSGPLRTTCEPKIGWYSAHAASADHPESASTTREQPPECDAQVSRSRAVAPCVRDGSPKCAQRMWQIQLDKRSRSNTLRDADRHSRPSLPAQRDRQRDLACIPSRPLCRCGSALGCHALDRCRSTSLAVAPTATRTRTADRSAAMAGMHSSSSRPHRIPPTPPVG